MQRLALWLVAGMAGVVGALTLAFELLQAVGLASSAEPSDGAAAAAFVVGAVVGLLSWAFWEDWWFRNRSPGVAITLDPSGLVRGGRVVGHLELDAAGEPPGGATEVGLVCTELADLRVTLRGHLKEDGLGRFTHVTRLHESWAPVGEGGSALLEIPAEAPASYEGTRLSIAWHLAVRADPDSAPIAEVPVWVAP